MCKDEYEERAAIMQFDAGYSKEVAEQFAKTITLGPYKNECPIAWQQGVDAMLSQYEKAVKNV